LQKIRESSRMDWSKW